jgi:Carbohydrate family 9 binding domain-like
MKVVRANERTAGAALAALIALALGGGCIEQDAPPQKRIDPAYVKKNVLRAPPAAMKNKVNADLGGYVVYLGNDVEPTSLKPGDEVRVVHYWKVVAPPGEDWRVFTHLVGSGDSWKNLDQSDMRIGYPPGQWKAGDIIRDEQEFTLDKDWKSPYAQLAVGLYRKGSSSAEDRMRIESGPADEESRVLAFRFKTGRGDRPKTPPQYMVRRAKGPIAIDGKADEKDWQTAPPSPAFSPAEGGPEIAGSARARLVWDDKHLYALVEVEDADVHSQYKAQDDPLWKEDAVELFIDADRNRRGYVELQVNPRNAHFDAWFPRTRAEKNHPEWTSKMKSAVAVRGTLDERGDKDQGWIAEIAIPLADVKGTDQAMKVTVPPELGDRWRLNVVRVDKPADGKLQASSWSAIPIADFHALGRMVTVVFAEADGSVPERTRSPGPDKTSYPAGKRAPTSAPASDTKDKAKAQSKDAPKPG